MNQRNIRIRCSVTRGLLFACFLNWVVLLNAAGASNANLALKKVCRTFSSIESNNWSVVALTDGKRDSGGWSSRAYGAFSDHEHYPEYVVVDLETNSLIYEVVLVAYRGSGSEASGFPLGFSIAVCQEGEAWRTIHVERDFKEPAKGEAQVFKFRNGELGRYVKVEATKLRKVASKTHRFRLAELEVFGRLQDPVSLKLDKAHTGNKAAVARLRCENRENPIGMDASQPRFSWWMESSVRGQRQTAFRLLVAQDSNALNRDIGEVWDSGKVESDSSIAINYGGKALQSGRQYWWKVMLWDKDGKPTGWSVPSMFTTGKLRPDDWRGNWIGADQDINHRPVYLRKEIDISKPVRRATVFFCGLGFSELYLNGDKVGDYVIGPGFTTYDKRVQYLTFDVTKNFSRIGPVAVAAILADGWYGLEKDPWVHQFEKNHYVDRPKLLLDLQIEYADGSEQTFTSDGSWQWSFGEIISSWIARENIDLRETRKGWDRPGFDVRGWRQVGLVKGPAGKLVNQKEPPCRVVGEVKPVAMHYDRATRICRYELDQEVTGWVRFQASGPAGTKISIITEASRPEPRTNYFILAGTGKKETYEPRFYYIGMQRVEVHGLSSPPSLEDLVVRKVSSSWPVSGGFRCSDDLANWLNDTVRRTVVAYTTWLPNDSVREWKGWVQDIQGMFKSSVYLYDSQTIYERWQADMVDGQRADGNCPNVAPGAFFDEYNSPWWGGCVAWLPWHWYHYYGDAALLKDSYPAMKKYVNFLQVVATNGVQDWGLLDWLPVEETPRPIINTPAHFLYANIVAQTAQLIGHTTEADFYTGLAQSVSSNFNALYLDAATGIYGIPGWECRPGNYPDSILKHETWWSGNRPCTQAGQTLPLALGMVPVKHQSAVQQALRREIKAHRGRLSTGFVSTPYLLDLLADLDPQIGHAITSAQDYPSWYSMTAGSDNDVMKETWGGGMALMPSLGGNIAAWQMESLGGIRPDSSGPGFKKFLIKPNLVGSLHWVDTWYDSVHGRIISKWRKRGTQLVMDVTIPPNTMATIFVPAESDQVVTESGLPAGRSSGIRMRQFQNGRAVFEVASGRYQFVSKLPPVR
jgi:alpha-L-rhamnosidase